MSKQTTSTKRLSPSTAGSAYLKRIDNGKGKAIWRTRILFVVCLSCVAVVLGFTANHFLTNAEDDLANSQFESSADRALNEALVITRQKRWSAVTMSSIAAQVLPDAGAFPFVTIPGFEKLTYNLLKTSSNEDMGFVPFVRPDELAEWEDFIYNYYDTSTDPVFPNGTGVSSFGKGVWATNPSLDAPDKRYHDKGTKTPYGSPYDILAPITQLNNGPHPVLLFNLHFEPTRGQSLDRMIACSEERAVSGGNLSSLDCGV